MHIIVHNMIAYLSLWKGAATSDISPSDEKTQSLNLQIEEKLLVHTVAEVSVHNTVDNFSYRIKLHTSEIDT